MNGSGLRSPRRGLVSAASVEPAAAEAEVPGGETMVDPTLAEMGKNLNEAMKMLEDSQRKVEEENEKKYARKDIPGPLQGRLQNVGEQGHMALLGHSLAAYISVLDRERLRKLTTRILSDTTLWLCRLFRYENGSAYYHEDDREGLLKICRLVIHTRYEDYTVEGFNVLYTKQPVIYISSAARTGLGQALCNQLGLPLSCMCRVPCNTMFGSQHQMDVALLDRLIKDDVESGKLPLLLVANAGTPGAGHTDKLGRLKELCEQYNMWLHVEGVNLATLALGYVSSSVLAATKCDSMTLTLGSWLGLPAVPAVTLYRHEDPSLSLAAGLTSSQPVEKLRALPLWLSLQYLGHDGIVERIKHASQLVSNSWLLENLKNLDFIKTSVEDELSSPVLGEQLAQLVPASGADVVELEDEGTCVRFSPLMTSAGPEFGGQKNCVYIGMVTEDLDVSELVETIAATGREIEENSRLLENMTEVVRKGIQEAQLQLQKANEERLLEEGVLRQIPVVGSVLNWFSPFQASPKGRTFNLTAGSLESTESTYVSKAQGTGTTPPPTPSSSLAKQRLPGKR
ncbi:pyridoxal-dependent decarboxylase domain-containing protein 1 [Limosa lapponica baueri]|uniref:Pyridoxal-dependent decarboxylase domain-containing protein 1 n=1 Tax=Limosa lapponica baueri TaxID=1758121 RepID=A0A2I0UG33_LIMLA|nr:pyridoxal-dependent decarboxylase domain-containing protein 1 [Limosa lapponica baueri]